MTNREWIESLNYRQLIAFFEEHDWSKCSICSYGHKVTKNECCDKEDCIKGRFEWLNAEHDEK